VPGVEVVVVAPHGATATTYAGAEFDPAGRTELLLVGDETAVPALTRILADLPAGHTGDVFVEVPSEADLLPMPPPEAIEVHWIFRGDAAYGRRLAAAVRGHLGLRPEPETVAVEPPPSSGLEVWETAAHSASGEDLDAGRRVPAAWSDLYAWIAGESWAVRSLRRALVDELGLDRAQVAFMGYWRQGVAMRS
jgi:NADPH-dependent ferric siderophore reductase